ncbi:MAG: hypothetical protein C4306_06025 [Thermoleophilia bacterium]
MACLHALVGGGGAPSAGSPPGARPGPRSRIGRLRLSAEAATPARSLVFRSRSAENQGPIWTDASFPAVVHHGRSTVPTRATAPKETWYPRSIHARPISCSSIQVARVLERLGLDYCCGEKRSLAEACQSKGLDLAGVDSVLEAESLSGEGKGERGARQASAGGSVLASPVDGGGRLVRVRHGDRDPGRPCRVSPRGARRPSPSQLGRPDLRASPEEEGCREPLPPREARSRHGDPSPERPTQLLRGAGRAPDPILPASGGSSTASWTRLPAPFRLRAATCRPFLSIACRSSPSLVETRGERRSCGLTAGSAAGDGADAPSAGVSCEARSSQLRASSSIDSGGTVPGDKRRSDRRHDPSAIGLNRVPASLGGRTAWGCPARLSASFLLRRSRADDLEA